MEAFVILYTVFFPVVIIGLPLMIGVLTRGRPLPLETDGILAVVFTAIFTPVLAVGAGGGLVVPWWGAIGRSVPSGEGLLFLFMANGLLQFLLLSGRKLFGRPQSGGQILSVHTGAGGKLTIVRSNLESAEEAERNKVRVLVMPDGTRKVLFRPEREDGDITDAH